MGVSVRRLHGWEPVEHVEYVLDDSGAVVGHLVTREAEFTPAEVAVLLASRRVERERGAHGIPMGEATDPANQFAFEGQKGPVTDWAQKSLEDDRDRYYKLHDSKDNPVNRNGHIWGVTWRE